MDELEDYAIKKVAKGGFIIFLGIVLSSIAVLFYKVLAARYLGPGDYGLLTLGITILNFAWLLGLAGMHQSIGKFINHHLAKKQYDQVKGILISSFVITIAFSIIILIFLYSSSAYIGNNLFKIQGLDTIIKIFSIGIPFSVLTQLLKYYFYAFKKPEYVIISESVFEKMLNLIFIILVIYVSASLFTLSWAYVISLIISSVAATLLLKSKLKNILKKELKPKFNFKQLISFSFPLMITGFLGAALVWTDTIFIGIFKSEVDVGIYNAAFIIASALMIFWLSFGDIFYPIISELYAKRAKASIRKIFEVASRWIFILVLPIFIFVLAFPTRTLSITFGQNYLEASVPLVILIMGYFFATLFGLSEQGLRTFKKTKFLGISTTFALVGNIILNIILIPLYGIVGAAIATTLSLIILSLTKLFVFKRILKFGYNRLLYLKYLSSGIISFIVVFYTFGLLDLFSTYFFIAGILMFMVLYLILLVVFKSFSEEDLVVLEAVERKIGIELTVIKRLLR